MRHDLRHAVRLNSRTLADLAWAIVELAVARVGLTSKRASAGPAANDATGAIDNLDAADHLLVERVAFAIPRAAARVPWRSDCLVQALAAERWLRRSGVPSTIHFGVPKDQGGMFEAHAWLTVGERVVTGGDIAGHSPFRR